MTCSFTLSTGSTAATGERGYLAWPFTISLPPPSRPTTSSKTPGRASTSIISLTGSRAVASLANATPRQGFYIHLDVDAPWTPGAGNRFKNIEVENVSDPRGRRRRRAQDPEDRGAEDEPERVVGEALQRRQRQWPRGAGAVFFRRRLWGARARGEEGEGEGGDMFDSVTVQYRRDIE